MGHNCCVRQGCDYNVNATTMIQLSLSCFIEGVVRAETICLFSDFLWFFPQKLAYQSSWALEFTQEVSKWYKWFSVWIQQTSRKLLLSQKAQILAIKIVFAMMVNHLNITVVRATRILLHGPSLKVYISMFYRVYLSRYYPSTIFFLQ